MEIDRLYATMFHEWDALQKDVTDIEEAIRCLTWSVNPFTRDGEEPEPLAAEVAKTVQDALWMRSTPVPGSVGHTFQQMLGAVVHAVYRGFNVHQIEWKNDGELVYPARFIQLPPQFLMWENRAGRPDRLLLVPDGMNYKGVPFPAHKFIVALNTSGPDHPIYNATFYSLVNWFLAFKKGLGWFMEYTQKYGMPKQILYYQSDRDRAQLMADLRDDSVLNTVLLKEGRDIDIQYPTGGSASLPQAVLLQKAEEACHKAILGQTLTSDTSSNGGSLAQAKVHAGVQADVVLKRAEFVADVLNQQLIPAIVMANYGRIDGIPMPELRCKLPQAEANIERAQFLKTALEVPGVEIIKSEAYEYLGLAMPTEGDEVLKAPEQPQQQPGGMPGGFPRGGEVLGKEKPNFLIAFSFATIYPKILSLISNLISSSNSLESITSATFSISSKLSFSVPKYK
jgi:phage gp29-like protein